MRVVAPKYLRHKETMMYFIILLLELVRYIFSLSWKFHINILNHFEKYSKKSIGDVISVGKCISFNIG